MIFNIVVAELMDFLPWQIVRSNLHFALTNIVQTLPDYWKL